MAMQSYQNKAFDDSVKEEIRSIVNIADVVGRHVVLKPAGQNLKGLCPFHKEKTPSFTVSPAKGIYYCFGCHKGGDVFNFLMELEGLTFPEALRQLADETGVKLAPRQSDTREPIPDEIGEDPSAGISKTELLAINQMALDFYYRSTRGSKQAIDYFLSRGLTRETIRDFKLGYAPEGWTAFLDFAKSNGVSESSVVRGGLAIAKQETGRIYDRFRDRIMFPIFDISRRPVGFAGRGMTKDAMPKYLNSPETPLYQKSKILYGFHVTQQHIRESKSVIIVEGYMDFLSLYQAGIKNVIATAGTAFTDTHARTLRRFAPTIFLVFDGDAAGIEAARRAITVLAPYNFDIRVLTIPDDQDPDDYVRKHGNKGFLDILAASRDYMRFIIDRAVIDNTADSPYGKSAALTTLSPLVAAITDTVVKREFVKLISEALSLPEDLVYKRIRQANVSPALQEKQSKDTAAAYFGTIEGNFIRLLLNNPDRIKEARHFILPETFSDQFSGKLYSMLLTSYDEDARLTTLLGGIPDEETKRIISYAYALEAPGEDAREEVIHTIGRLQSKYLQKQVRDISDRMRKEPRNRTELLERLKEYSTQLKALSDT
jgi:DNA primase